MWYLPELLIFDKAFQTPCITAFYKTLSKEIEKIDVSP